MGLLDPLFAQVLSGFGVQQEDPQGAMLSEFLRLPQQPAQAQAQQPLPTGHMMPQTQQAAPQPRPMAPPEPNFLDRMSALARGYGEGGLIGGIADAVNLGDSRGERAQAQQRNDTFRYLVPRFGEEAARAAMGNPEILKHMLSPKALDMDVAEVYDDQGRPQKVVVNKQSGQTTPIGGPGVAKVDPIEMLGRREEFREQADARKADAKRMAELKGAADDARQQIDDVRNLGIARQGVGYEGGFATGLRTQLGKWLPDTPSWAPGLPLIPSREEAGRAESVEALSENVRLGFVQKTKGAVSDSEMRIFGMATPGMQMTDAGARTVMEGMDAAAARTVERAKFAEAWRRERGSLEGADEAWDSYVARNPIIMPDGRGGFTVNKANIGNWRNFMGGGQQAPAATGAEAAPASAGGWGIRRLD
jgi:hypothetical protein